MDMTFTGRGLHVTDQIRGLAEQKLAPLARIEPRATTLDLEVINENHPRPGGLKRVEASLRIPRKTFRAHAEADDVPAAIDLVRDKLERQLRDHHGKKRPPHRKGALGYAEAEAEARPEPGPAD
jgi:putative sigma-54 modulation protein